MLFITLVSILNIGQVSDEYLINSCEKNERRRQAAEMVAGRLNELQGLNPDDSIAATDIDSISTISVGNIGTMGMPGVICEDQWKNLLINGLMQDSATYPYCGVIISFKDSDSLGQFARYVRFLRRSQMTIESITYDDLGKILKTDEYTAPLCAKLEKQQETD